MKGDETPAPDASPSFQADQQNAGMISSVFAGRYEIESMLGAGGMGRIFKAYDTVSQRHVALKFVRTEDPELERRLLREAHAQAKIEHDSICKIFDVGQADGKLFIAMHYVEGNSLDGAMDWPISQKVQLMKQTAEAIHAAHLNGLIHRDIKPSNIMLEQSESGEWRPCIVDFGLVRDLSVSNQSVSGAVHGTPYYMSPEQATGVIHRIDPRSDIYSIGATFYELLCGRTPFTGNVIDVFIKLVEEECEPVRKVNPDIPVALETIVMKCLEKHRDRRYSSARELADELGRFLQEAPIIARQKTWTDRALQTIERKFKRKKI